MAAAPGDVIEWVTNKSAPHNVLFEASGVPGGDRALAASLSCKKLMMTPGEKQTTQIPADAPKATTSSTASPTALPGRSACLPSGLGPATSETLGPARPTHGRRALPLRPPLVQGDSPEAR
ncbi:plastocyanin/azurin family copper-binding protein [Streptomyces sp. NRRL F-5630]|uniref:plastocyanin/azurin family copper-binding protein n=1 Tax=Streptomyces sp. NRRL F-5630 TaxID=1463864 RepID=UPI003D756ADE